MTEDMAFALYTILGINLFLLSEHFDRRWVVLSLRVLGMIWLLRGGLAGWLP